MYTYMPICELYIASACLCNEIRTSVFVSVTQTLYTLTHSYIVYTHIQVYTYVFNLSFYSFQFSFFVRLFVSVWANIFLVVIECELIERHLSNAD